MASKIDNDPIPTGLRDLIALFAQELSDVKFPGVDGDTLNALAARVTASAADIEQALAQLAQLENTLGETRAELLTKAEQALAYAKVYASSDNALLGKLNAIALPRLGKPANKPAKTKVKVKAAGEGQGAARKEKAKKVDSPTAGAEMIERDAAESDPAAD